MYVATYQRLSIARYKSVELLSISVPYSTYLIDSMQTGAVGLDMGQNNPVPLWSLEARI